MKPPICRICGKKLENGEGSLVSFTLTESDRVWKAHMAKIGGIGHPPWMDWFCEKHIAKAQSLANYDIGTAITMMKQDIENS